jgi:hypothetical protein
MTNYILKFKNKETPGNLHISTCKNIIDNKYVIEFWDINKDYHSLMPLIEFKKGFWNKYNNKRVLISKEEYYNTFETIKELEL